MNPRARQNNGASRTVEFRSELSVPADAAETAPLPDHLAMYRPNGQDYGSPGHIVDTATAHIHDAYRRAMHQPSRGPRNV